MRSVTVGAVEIKQANDHGPDGRKPVKWIVHVGGQLVAQHLDEPELLELAIAIEAWRKANYL